MRPDCGVVCGEFKKNFLTFTAQLILEVFSHSTRLRDRNTKLDFYKMYEVKYFIIADCDKKTTEIFELTGNKSRQTGSKNFSRTETCSINFDEFNLFV